jgi:heme exporter protein B
MLLSEIKYLLKKEIMLEWRQKYAINGIFLYVASTVFVAYLSFKMLENAAIWNALFWIIILFASTNAVTKSFMQETKQRQLYLYTISSPQAVILSKIIYNILLMLLVTLITFIFYSMFLGMPVQNLPMFLLSLIIGSSGFASIMTLISAIAAKTGNNSTLMAILSFPIILPFLLTLIRLSQNAITGAEAALSYSHLITLLAIIVILIILSYILFPYLWRD